MQPPSAIVRLVLAAAALSLAGCQPAKSPPKPVPPGPTPISAPDLDGVLAEIYAQSGAVGMVAAVVRGDQVTVRGFGRMGPSDPRTPDGATLVRLQSISKLLNSQVLASLVVEGRLRGNDPLQRYAPPGVAVPVAKGARPIELVDLATHTSGLPRNAAIGIIPDAAPATAARWAWLNRLRNLPAPGSEALYSNGGFDLLADALQAALGEPYPASLKRLVTGPNGMADTTPSPSPEQCRRMLAWDPDGPARPCIDNAATAGSGGVYSTANDMAAWMKRQLAPDHGGRVGRLGQTIFYRREALVSMKGFDGGGAAAGMGLAWVELTATTEHPRLLEKTGGGGGFLTYIAIAPAERVGVFIAVDRVSHPAHVSITAGANTLTGALVGQIPAAAVTAAIAAEMAKPSPAELAPPPATPPKPVTHHRRPHRHHR